MFVSYLVPEKAQRVQRVLGVSCCHAMQMFFSKSNGHKNPEMGHKVINFMLALSVHNKKAFDFVSANLHSVGNQWIGQITATQCTPPFIRLTESQVGHISVN